MITVNQLFFDIWREACQHIEITESCERFHKRLSADLPLDTLYIFRLDNAAATLELLAAAPSNTSGGHPAGMRHLSERQTFLLNNWAQQKTVLSWQSQNEDSTKIPEAAQALMTEKAPAGSWLAAPLSDPAGHNGFIAMHSSEKSGIYEPPHETVIKKLCEPFAAALQNDLRLREMRSLRNAAEAEKSAALRRLGREQISTEIVGAAHGLHAVMQRVEQVAQADVPVLILGETGTGKEVIARAIHNHSRRAQNPFIRVNSGAIPPELIDSELFGHEKGAFTGAESRRQGWFERADGGTLLLDEIGELSLQAQIRLLRVLQEGEIQRVGGNKSIHINVRIIAATHRDLPGMIQDGKFREDLWYRLNVFPIVLPPLRERRGDLPALAAHFCARAARRFGVRVINPSPEDLNTLADYDWPGNIRELASVIDRAVIIGEGERFDIKRALGTPIVNTGSGIERSTTPVSSPATAGKQGYASLNDTIRMEIEKALQATHGRVEGPNGAAAILKINPNTLRSKMRRLEINWRQFRTNKG